MSYLNKIRSRDELKRCVDEAKRLGKVVVQCHGCFDILHPGHLRHLAWAKEQGDLLIVSVSADSVVNKGHLRPFVPEQLRAENLAALEMVDYVTIDAGEWAGPILELLQPQVYVKGKEFQNVVTGRIGRERQLVEAYGGEVRFSSGDVVYSSTRIIQDFRDRLESGIEPIEAFCRRHALTFDSVSATLDRFQGKTILVVGDTIVDRYVYCDRLGMSAEAPVLVVRPLDEETFLGGSGIVAQHVQSLGASVRFCSVIGDDQEGAYVRRELEQRHVPSQLITDPLRPTTLKTRYLSEGKKLLNVNQFRDHGLDLSVETQLREAIAKDSGKLDAIVVCDFAYGVITNAVLQTLCESGHERRIPILGDVQCSSQMGNVTRLKGITMVTPSEKEARLALCDRDSGIADLGAMIMTQTGNQALVITLAERGLMIFDAGDAPAREDWRTLPLHEIKKHLRTEYLPSFAGQAADPVGAGDALLATISCCLAAGASTMEAVFIGNCAAAIEVSKVGNVPVGRREIQQTLRNLFRVPA